MKPLLLLGVTGLLVVLVLPARVDRLDTAVEDLREDNRRLQETIDPYRPRGTYLVVDTGNNRMRLMRDDRVVIDALVSTGSGVRLVDPANPRSWVFDTPRGEFLVLEKILNPVWTKPDWAFIEVGEPLPETWSDRIEEGVLGEYALDLGDGYLIHGSLFERSLGLHVTHGCIRVGADDLEAIFDSVEVGTKVYII